MASKRKLESKPKQKPKRLYLIDGAGFYYRAYYGIRHNLTAADGTPTNATYGFATMFRKIIRDEKPDAIAIALDSREKTFRHEMYPEYKANRDAMPEDLAVQIPYIERMIKAHNVAILKKPGLEADDLLACATQRAVKHGYDVTIVTGDKDLMQLVTDRVTVLDPMKDKRIDPAGVKEKFGVPPELLGDMLALMGDKSDNIPGVPGVGEKTALALINEHGNLENVLKNTDKIKRPKLRQSLIDHAQDARLSRNLVELKTDLDMEMDIGSWQLPEPDTGKLKKLFAELNFKSLITELAESATELGGEKQSEPASLEASAVSEVKAEYSAVLTQKELKKLCVLLESSKGFAVDTETTSTEPMNAKLVGLSFSVSGSVSSSASEYKAYYVPVAHDYEGAPKQLSKKEALKTLKPVLENPKIEKYGQNIKYDKLVLAREGVDLHPVSFDTMVASYLLSPEDRRHGLGYIAQKYMGYKMVEYKDVAGKGAKEIPFSHVEVPTAADYSAEDADMTLRLTGILKKLLEKENLNSLYYDIELPLIDVLCGMEKNGILIDTRMLMDYSIELEKKLHQIEKEIYAAAGEEFNINSPKQLSEIFFEKLKLPTVRKTKTGYSTDQKTLETLAVNHPLPALILRYRTLSKLKSTYVDPLPQLVNAETGRIHTSFNQAVTATGRLSSSSPNLQNIPVRTEEGREIRRAFHADEGCKLISADYSQIELRILAHLSGDELLLESFKNDEDVHTRTAREIFGALAAGKPTSEMRRAAKAVNFGIIYGQTAFGLSRELGIGRGEAQSYIDSYFVRYRGVKEFIDETIERARKDLFVATIWGRRRKLPDLKSSNRNVREMAQRMAVNTIVQGSAADLIKLAMLKIGRMFAKTNTRMLLQVHDELIFESPDAELNGAAKKIKQAMETAADFSVPLKVKVSIGKNWGELN